jgi:hypothetical protein
MSLPFHWVAIPVSDIFYMIFLNFFLNHEEYHNNYMNEISFLIFF